MEELKDTQLSSLLRRRRRRICGDSLCLAPPRKLTFFRDDARPACEIDACALKLSNATLLHPAAPLEVAIGAHKGLDRIWEMRHDRLREGMRENVLRGVSGGSRDIREGLQECGASLRRGTLRGRYWHRPMQDGRVL